MEILYLLIGLTTGISIGVLYNKNKSAQNESNSDLNNYVAKELYTSEKERSEKEIAKSRVWRTEDEEFSGLFQSLDEDGYVIIVVDRDDKAHKMAEKGREWTTSSGSSVKAILKERKRDKITLLRKSDDFTMVFKKKELSEEDQKFLERLKWDNEKTKKILIDKFLSQDQRLVRSATGTVKAGEEKDES